MKLFICCWLPPDLYETSHLWSITSRFIWTKSSLVNYPQIYMKQVICGRLPPDLYEPSHLWSITPRSIWTESTVVEYLQIYMNWVICGWLPWIYVNQVICHRLSPDLYELSHLCSMTPRSRFIWTESSVINDPRFIWTESSVVDYSQIYMNWVTPESSVINYPHI